MEEKYKILLVDDDQIDCMAFERLVKQENLPYTYDIAGSVSAARDILAAAQFDVALIDYLLGDGVGFDLFAQLDGTPIIIVTGSGGAQNLRLTVGQAIVPGAELDPGGLDAGCFDLAGQFAQQFPRLQLLAVGAELLDDALEGAKGGCRAPGAGSACIGECGP